ncbi:Hsp20/alpha crystallin family protein [Sphingomonas cannabina]|uniref:Hsp20/alpha crystallin family protein n=1 Tax=Sphingomonas cannabina TaxID=2899123 RepID=UPI001F228A5E|nr:Hsp20/alpha crystallin family protein [Sphingomonas cannabina]UIJ45340.1 Hsp20/alpha crystallin family protein [Sphingomonas cannabina]
MARELTPWDRERESRQLGSYGRESSPFFTLRRELDRLFDDVFRGWNLPVTGGERGRGWPSLEVSETDKELRITAELPGMTEKDVDLGIEDGVLTIRGERRQEEGDQPRGYTERYYGKFERRLSLPRGIDEDKAEARFEHGVLTVTLPKGPEADRGRRIPINADTRH